MRKIILVTPLNNFQLLVKFDDGSQKKVDMNPYFETPVFSVLKTDEEAFKKVVNREYYIEWPALELDLSADTLWHDGRA